MSPSLVSVDDENELQREQDQTVGGCVGGRSTFSCKRIKITSKEPVFSDLAKFVVPELISIENILMSLSM
jgi:hypothetical protein